MHLEGRTLLEFRQAHPHERVARRIPLVDLVRIDGCAVLAREPDVVRRAASLGVGEAVVIALRELHERLEARKRRRARVAHGLQRHRLRHGERRQWCRRNADCRRDKRDAVTDATKRIRPSSLRKRGTHCYSLHLRSPWSVKNSSSPNSSRNLTIFSGKRPHKKLTKYATPIAKH